ncbi:MAG: PAS domain-containing protein [Devosia sp.]|uniref:PAS domain-containing sensor histidine kinase n=1 Tax=unclassified Devosia TaxID=196773 RepID=UPI0019E24DA6|nr:MULTISPECIES: PAS domain-containing protein [unclassified Devosia]MBF0678400.1 PAS domain-containing protein [Devosia sp.]WEJ32321.1 PAS domain-containing protein [Devosia sp. SD17-2]
MPKSLFPNASAERRDELERDPTVKLLNEFDWGNSSVGAIPDWPESLKGAVRLVMVASTPMVMMVGRDGLLIYNDAYAHFAGQRHPAIFGMPAVDAWPEIAEFNRNNIERGLRGESYALRDQELVLNRYGQLESGWMDLHYSPIVDDDGTSMGTLCVVHETTDRVLAKKALDRSEERMSLALAGSALVGTWDWNVLDNVVTSDDQFAAMYNIDPQLAGLGAPIEQYMLAIDHEDLARVGAELQRALDERSDYRIEYRVVANDGTRRWLMASGRPRVDAEGRVYRFPGVAIDVTHQRQAAEELSRSELRFRTLADAMPQMVWTTRADGHCDYYNARWFEQTGIALDEADFETWASMYHPDDRERAMQAWDRALKTGEPYEIEYRIRHRNGEYRWALGRSLPIRDEQGEIIRWIGTCTDIHETKLLAQERELVAQELSHRIKNIFAVLNGIIGLSARGRPEVKAFADELRQRIYALGEAHDFVRPQSHARAQMSGEVVMSALIDRLMVPYEIDGRKRVVFAGDDIEVDDAAATPLALLFHELGTNSAKYGAFHQATGLVRITGTLNGEIYNLEWHEENGPAVTEPEVLRGFGTRLVQIAVEGQLRGAISREWRPDGLVMSFDFPLDSLRHSNRLRPRASR